MPAVTPNLTPGSASRRTTEPQTTVEFGADGGSLTLRAAGSSVREMGFLAAYDDLPPAAASDEDREGELREGGGGGAGGDSGGGGSEDEAAALALLIGGQGLGAAAELLGLRVSGGGLSSLPPSLPPCFRMREEGREGGRKEGWAAGHESSRCIVA